MIDNIYNALSMASLGFAMYIIPALIYGSLIALPSVLFFLLQKFSHHHFPNLSLFAVCLTGFCSFILVLLSITRSMIGLSYAITIPSSPNWEEKQRYESAAIAEATYRSLVPMYFQKPCIKIPEVICQLGQQYAIEPWNLRDGIARMPVISGLVASLVSLLIGLRAQIMISVKSLPDPGNMQAI
jgi:hypothetical protein